MSPENFKLGRSSVQTAAESITSVSSGAIMKERQRPHKAARKPSDENKPFDPGSEYSPLLSPRLSLGSSVTMFLARLFFFALLSFRFQLVQYGVIMSLQQLTLDILNNEGFARTSLIYHHIQPFF